jgi:hypothetical protein
MNVQCKNITANTTNLTSYQHGNSYRKLSKHPAKLMEIVPVLQRSFSTCGRHKLLQCLGLYMVYSLQEIKEKE